MGCLAPHSATDKKLGNYIVVTIERVSIADVQSIASVQRRGEGVSAGVGTGRGGRGGWSVSDAVPVGEVFGGTDAAYVVVVPLVSYRGRRNLDYDRPRGGGNGQTLV
jgi:hypothetical protein